MTEQVNPEPERVNPDTAGTWGGMPPMPPEIAQAIIQVMSEVQLLGHDEKNEHGKYNYTSIDAFLASLRPLLAKAGLMIVLEEHSTEVRKPSETGSAWLFAEFLVTVYHISTKTWGPLRRSVALPMTGAQSFGAAESYVQKRLLRGLFMVPTGDKDADDVAPSEGAPTTQPATRGNPAVRRATPEGERDRARQAYARLQNTIEDAPTVEALREIWDDEMKIWLSPHDADARLVTAASPVSINQLRKRLLERMGR